MNVIFNFWKKKLESETNPNSSVKPSSDVMTSVISDVEITPHILTFGFDSSSTRNCIEKH